MVKSRFILRLKGLAQQQEKRWFIFYLRRKMNHVSSLARAKRARD
ncbi:MAG: hypothetical protein U5L45_22895 [Saprospiraceae bacterium]|nr:hypothetical protein [Saprospiraceae bacterium]